MHATTLVRRLLRNSLLVAGLLLVLTATAGIAYARQPPIPDPTPEIAPAAMAGALTLLGGGLLVLRSRWR